MIDVKTKQNYRIFLILKNDSKNKHVILLDVYVLLGDLTTGTPHKTSSTSAEETKKSAGKVDTPNQTQVS